MLAQSFIRRVLWLSEATDFADRNLVTETLTGLNGAVDPLGCTVQPMSLARLTSNKSWADRFSWGRTMKVRLHENQEMRRVSPDLLVVASRRVSSELLVSLGQAAEAPVLVVGRGRLGVERRPKVLFPVTDPRKADAGFWDLVSYCKVFGSVINVLYRSPNTDQSNFWAPMIAQFGTMPFYAPSERVVEVENRKTLKSWIDRARRQGVDADLTVDETTLGIARSISHHEESKRCDAIAVDPTIIEIPGFRRALTQITRESVCPIWILNPGRTGLVGEPMGVLQMSAAV